MNKRIAILGALLAAQLLLALGLNLAGDDYGAFQPEEKLLAFDADRIDGLRIEDGENSVTLHKADDRWLLPELGAYPAGDGKAEALLNKLAGLEKGWPVATSAGAAERFKLAPDAFERRISLLAGDDARAVLYVGTSPGFRKVHLRPDGDEAVYAAAFSTWEAGAKAADWVDKTVLELKPEEITGIRMPDFELLRDGEVMKLADLGEQEVVRQDKIDAFVRQLAGLRIQSVLGKEDRPEYGQGEPLLEISVTRKEGDALNYRISKPTEGDGYVLKRSDRDHYFELAGFSVDSLQETGRTSLLQSKDNGVAAESAAVSPDTAG